MTMTVLQLKSHLEKCLAAGIDPNLPIKFRNEKGRYEDIDYSVMSNEGDCLLLAEEWFS